MFQPERIWFTTHYNKPMFFPKYEEYTGMRLPLLYVEMYAIIFIHNEKEAAQVIIEEEMQPMNTTDKVLAKWEKLFWEGKDPFEGKKASEILGLKIEKDKSENTDEEEIYTLKDVSELPKKIDKEQNKPENDGEIIYVSKE